MPVSSLRRSLFDGDSSQKVFEQVADSYCTSVLRSLVAITQIFLYYVYCAVDWAMTLPDLLASVLCARRLNNFLSRSVINSRNCLS